ncbi:hypothetical protein ABC374_10105 [Peribacillus sp. 1P06PB]|uniref:hypothetical protein n=2 Tax=unclassified Peribacillus TaxID=2675266 RepID=UPI0039A2E9EE
MEQVSLAGGPSLPHAMIEKQTIKEAYQKFAVKDRKVEGVSRESISKDTDKALLTNEGKVGTYKQLVKQGTAFDNITPHHMPSAEKMKQAGIKRNDGVSMNMEQPHPGTGGRHRETYTYGLSGEKSKAYLNLSFRDALAHDILDA